MCFSHPDTKFTSTWISHSPWHKSGLYVFYYTVDLSASITQSVYEMLAVGHVHLYFWFTIFFLKIGVILFF